MYRGFVKVGGVGNSLKGEVLYLAMSAQLQPLSYLVSNGLKQSSLINWL